MLSDALFAGMQEKSEPGCPINLLAVIRHVRDVDAARIDRKNETPTAGETACRALCTYPQQDFLVDSTVAKSQWLKDSSKTTDNVSRDTSNGSYRPNVIAYR
jgi:hypothetical protein